MLGSDCKVNQAVCYSLGFLFNLRADLMGNKWQKQVEVGKVQTHDAFQSSSKSPERRIIAFLLLMNCREQPAPAAVGIRSKRQPETDEPLLLMNVVNESAPVSVCASLCVYR